MQVFIQQSVSVIFNVLNFLLRSELILHVWLGVGTLWILRFIIVLISFCQPIHPEGSLVRDHLGKLRLIGHYLTRWLIAQVSLWLSSEFRWFVILQLVYSLRQIEFRNWAFECHWRITQKRLKEIYLFLFQRFFLFFLGSKLAEFIGLIVLSL